VKTKERLYVWLNNGTFVEKDGCTHPQDIIAAAIGCSERTVIRCVQQLEAEGRLRVHRPRRRGACNTYYVACWNPARRSGVLNVLGAVRPAVLKRRRERDERLCQIKRTAQPCKGADPQATPSSLKVVDQRCGRATPKTGFRRTRMDQRRRPHITAVPDLTCEQCMELAMELEAKTEIIRKLSVTNTELAEELSGAMEAARATGKENANLKRARTREARESAKAEQVEGVIEHWKKHRPKTKASSFPPGGRNWQTIEKALNLMGDDDDGPVRACCEAIDGLHIAPWEAYGKRYMKPRDGRTLRNRLEHALGDETKIERCRSIVRRVKADEADRAWELWLVAQATEQALCSVVLEKLGERGMNDVEPEPARFTVDGIVTTEDGR
jgi:DNA-binding Lrp family transcriptional regulator